MHDRVLHQHKLLVLRDDGTDECLGHDLRPQSDHAHAPAGEYAVWLMRKSGTVPKW